VLNATAVVNNTKAGARLLEHFAVGMFASPWLSRADAWLRTCRCWTRWIWTLAMRCGPPTGSSTRRLGWTSATGMVSREAGSWGPGCLVQSAAVWRCSASTRAAAAARAPLATSEPSPLCRRLLLAGRQPAQRERAGWQPELLPAHIQGWWRHLAGTLHPLQGLRQQDGRQALELHR
jgi:hypothetical protein